MGSKPKALYAFSGDPITYGHIDIVQRAAERFDVTVGIGSNPKKSYMFSEQERTQLAQRALEPLGVDVVTFKGLLVHFAYEQAFPTIIRGIRNAQDYADELALHQAGATQGHNIETILLLARPELNHVSSTYAKAVQLEHGDTHKFVPFPVKQALEAKMSKQSIIGLTGVSGSGKSYIGRLLGAYDGVHHVEMDELGHDILGRLSEPAYVSVRENIAELFGKQLLKEDGSIDRKALGATVFNDPKKLKELNGIMREPLLTRLYREIYGKQGTILINAALLADLDMTYLCNNNVILVDVNTATQERRLQERDDMTQEQVARRVNSQYSTEGKAERIQVAIASSGHGRLWRIPNNDGDINSHELTTLLEDIKIEVPL